MKSTTDKAHEAFLQACRCLSGSAGYWADLGPFKRWFFRLLLGTPLLGLDGSGARILKALRWLEGNAAAVPLGEETFRRYHRFVFDGARAGKYRTHPLTVNGIARPGPAEIPTLMIRLGHDLAGMQDAWDSNGPSSATVVHAAAEVHRRLGHIHPFDDANGRVARLGMNHLLRRYGFGYVVYPPLDQAPELLRALKLADRGDASSLKALASTFVHSV